MMKFYFTKSKLATAALAFIFSPLSVWADFSTQIPQVTRQTGGAQYGFTFAAEEGELQLTLKATNFNVKVHNLFLVTSNGNVTSVLASIPANAQGVRFLTAGKALNFNSSAANTVVGIKANLESFGGSADVEIVVRGRPAKPLPPGPIGYGYPQQSHHGFQPGGHSNAVAGEICTKYYSVSDQQSCLKDLGNVYLDPGAGTICKKYYSVSDQQSCLKSLSNVRISSAATEICTKYYSVSDQQSCLRDLANIFLDSGAGTICKKYYSVSDQQSCLKDLSNLRFSQSATDVCGKYYSVSDQQSCLKNLGNIYHSPGAGAICAKYYSVSDQQSCLKDLGNIRVSSAAAEVCAKYYSVSDQQSCLKNLGR